MNIVVLGATGGVGRCVVEQALEQGHVVTAASRNPDALRGPNGRLKILPCDVQDLNSVDRAVAGQDAVLCTVGTDSKWGATTLYSAAARNIGQAMRTHRVRRLVFLSNFGVLNERAQDLVGKALLFLVRRMIGPTLKDHRRALEQIAKDNVPEWVAVRALPLTDAPRTGRYRVAVDGLPPRARRIARADVADFMLKQASGNDYLGKSPAIAY